MEVYNSPWLVPTLEYYTSEKHSCVLSEHSQTFS